MLQIFFLLDCSRATLLLSVACKDMMSVYECRISRLDQGKNAPVQDCFTASFIHPESVETACSYNNRLLLYFTARFLNLLQLVLYCSTRLLDLCMQATELRG